MLLLEFISFVHILLFALLFQGSDVMCEFFQYGCNLVGEGEAQKATLNFTVNTTCSNTTSPLHVVSVKKKIPSARQAPTICQIFHDENGSCTTASVLGCTCEDLNYSVTTGVSDTGYTNLTLRAVMWDGEKIEKQIQVDKTTCTNSLVQVNSGEGCVEQISTVPSFERTAATEISSRTALSSVPMSETQPWHDHGRIVSTLERLKWLVVISTAVSAGVILILLVLICNMSRTIHKIKKRLPSKFLKNELPKPIDLKVAALSNVMYCGSNVSLMVSNDLYGVSLCDTLSTAVSSPVDARVGMPLLPGGTRGFAGAEKAEDGAAGNSLFEDKKESEGDYAEVNSLFGDNPDTGAEDGEDTYIEVSEIRRLKAEQRKLKEGAAVTRL